MASREQCKRALELHSQQLSCMENVVGLGVVPERDDGPATHCALAVYVERKLPVSGLAPMDVVPKFVEVPGRGKLRHRSSGRSGWGRSRSSKLRKNPGPSEVRGFSPRSKR